MDVLPELAELSRTIDPVLLGRRIRAARVAAGLTQGQLATPEASTAYLSRIESGERRPDLRLIVAFAAKADVTLEQLLLGLSRDRYAELRIRLDHAAWEIQHGDATTALAMLDEAGRALDDSTGSEVAAKVRYLTALAEHARGDLDAAIAGLEVIVDGDVTARRWLDAAVALTGLYVEAGDTAGAVGLGEKALAVLEADDVVQGHHALGLATSLALAHRARGDQDLAVATCRRVSPAPDDAGLALATVYYRASAAALEKNNVNLAAAYASSARRVSEAADQQITAARYHATTGHLLLAAERPDLPTARASLETATRMLTTAGADRNEAAAVRFSLARALLLDGELDTALALLDAGDTKEEGEGLTPALAATRHLLVGEIRLRTQQSEAAHASVTRAADALRGAGDAASTAQLWFELGSMLEELGDSDASRDAYRHAGAATGLAILHHAPAGPTGPRAPA